MSHIRALIVDCFGVFYDDPVFAYMRDPQTPSNKAKALHDLDVQAANGALDKANFLAQAAAITGQSPAETEQRFFRSNKRNEALVAFVIDAHKHFKIALLSNIGGDMMDGFFSKTDYEQLFDVVILSGNVGLTKPDLRIFRLACEYLWASPKEAVMIDDMQANIDVAQSLGMQGTLHGF